MDARKVTVTNTRGDVVSGLWRPPVMSDEPPTIQVGSTRWFEGVWRRDGWDWTFDAEE